MAPLFRNLSEENQDLLVQAQINSLDSYAEEHEIFGTLPTYAEVEEAIDSLGYDYVETANGPEYDADFENDLFITHYVDEDGNLKIEVDYLELED